MSQQPIRKALIEEWKDLPGYIGLYQVSDQGRVRGCSRYIFRRDSVGELHTKYVPAKLMAPKKRGNYLAVLLSNPLGQKFHSIHRLVCAAFLGPAGDLQVNHKDEDKYNNRLDNLEYMTHSENQVYSNGKEVTLIHTSGEVLSFKGIGNNKDLLPMHPSSLWRLTSGRSKVISGWRIL